MAYLIYRYLRKRSIRTMNFDNPVYNKKTTTSNNSSSGMNNFSPNNPYGAPSNSHFATNNGYNNSSSNSMEDTFHMVASNTSNNTSNSSFGSGGTSTFSNTNSTFSSNSSGGPNNRNPRVQYGVNGPDEVRLLRKLLLLNSLRGISIYGGRCQYLKMFSIRVYVIIIIFIENQEYNKRKNLKLFKRYNLISQCLNVAILLVISAKFNQDSKHSIFFKLPRDAL